MVLLISTTLVSSQRVRNKKPTNQNNARRQRQQQREETCSEPADLDGQLEGLNGSPVPGQLHPTFLLLPSLRQALNNSLTPLNDTSTCSQVFSGSATCSHQDAHAESPADPCLTYTCLNCDPNRHPRVLLETRCSCSECRGVSRRGVAQWPMCSGVFHPVRVLRRAGCRDGVYRYVPTWHQLQVGCVCKLVA
ncbi:uncharacterized protein LOC143286475 isoform X2 [Babylonia areolata]